MHGIIHQISVNFKYILNFSNKNGTLSYYMSG